LKYLRTLTIGLFCLLTYVSIGIAETLPERTEVKSPTGAAIRSALLPGWGQFYNRKPLKGCLLLCAESFLLTEIILEKRDSNISISDRRRSNTFILWWSGIKLYAILDAYVDAQLWGLGREEGVLTLGVIQDPDDCGVMLFYRFCL